MEEITKRLLDYGALGLVVVVCFIVIVALWKQNQRENAKNGRSLEVIERNSTVIQEFLTVAKEQNEINREFHKNLFETFREALRKK